MFTAPRVTRMQTLALSSIRQGSQLPPSPTTLRHARLLGWGLGLVSLGTLGLWWLGRVF